MRCLLTSAEDLHSRQEKDGAEVPQRVEGGAAHSQAWTCCGGPSSCCASLLLLHAPQHGTRGPEVERIPPAAEALVACPAWTAEESLVSSHDTRHRIRQTNHLWKPLHRRREMFLLLYKHSEKHLCCPPCNTSVCLSCTLFVFPFVLF